MRPSGCWAVAAAMVLGCSAGDGGGGSVASGSHSLVIHVSGAGTVQSATPSISCRADCQQDVAGAGTVLLTATADSGYAFSGWQGDCTGTAACSFRMDGDRAVSALFTASQPPTFRVTVKPTGSGGGRVTSTPAGIDCLVAAGAISGSCGMTAQAGSSVSLNAQPAADAT